MNKVRGLLRSFFLIGFFLNGIAVAAPDLPEVSPAHELFSDESLLLPDELQIKQTKEQRDPTIVNLRYVQIYFDRLKEYDSIVLNLFRDISETAVRDRTEKRSEDRYSWLGKIEGKDHSSVVLSVEDGNMAGNITVDGKTYQVRSVGDGIHAVREFDQSALPSEAPPIPVEVSEQGRDAPLPSTSQLDSADTIDVLVVYTDDTAAASFNIASEIQLAIDETNMSYQNSGINQRLQLVRTEEVNYFETGNMSGDLNCVRSKTDGCIDQVHAWRDNAGADMVSFWVENGGGFCGIAYIMTSVSGSFESSAFSVTARQCATGNYTFGHELGHNMGARHDRYVDSTDGSPFFFNHGFVNADPLDPWRTVMAYNARCSNFGFNCPRLLYWSNPDKNFNGNPMGVAEGQFDAADNRKTLDSTALTVANFRQGQETKFADVPSGYWAKDYIYAIFNAGITTGCSQNPLRYCPQDPVTRAQMAAFLVRAVDEEPPANYCATGSPFTDVSPASTFCNYIRRLSELGITQGCGGGNYCPNETVTRAQMAAFLVRAVDEEPPANYCATGSPFTDVSTASTFCKYIKRLTELAITTGCGGGNYCPNETVTRAQMAAFLARAFIGLE